MSSILMYELPIFPLHTVLFPGMPLRLHIFEPRYQEMFKRVLETSRTFGVCCIRTGEEALGPLALPYSVGCTARVIDVETLPDGHLNITAVGEERFHILNPASSHPYLSAVVESTPLQSHLSLDVVRGTQLLRRQVTSYLSILTSLAEINQETQPLDLDLDLTEIDLPHDPMLLIYLSASLLQVSPAEKQPLLEADTAALLLTGLQAAYRRELALLPGFIDTSASAAKSAWLN